MHGLHLARRDQSIAKVRLVRHDRNKESKVLQATYRIGRARH